MCPGGRAAGKRTKSELDEALRALIPTDAVVPPAGWTKLVPGKPCPLCGKKVGFSPAERKRRERARKRDG